jgi:protein-S-isoprenylcysteine O-methyltransferase Ste14
VSYPEWARHHRRDIAIPLLLLVLILTSPDTHFWIFSLLLVLVGESLRIWASGHLRKEQILTTGGPYRFIRNPLYVGSLFIALGFCLMAGSIWIWILVIAYFLLVYIPVIVFEEKTLKEKFPLEFEQYSAEVPRIIPGFHVYPGNTRFSWSQVIKNKEYNAVIGILLGYGYLYICDQRCTNLRALFTCF